MSRRTPGPSEPPSQRIPGFIPEDEAGGAWNNYSLPSRAKVKKGWNYILLRHGIDRGKLHFYLQISLIFSSFNEDLQCPMSSNRRGAVSNELNKQRIGALLQYFVSLRYYSFCVIPLLFILCYSALIHFVSFRYYSLCVIPLLFILCHSAIIHFVSFRYYSFCVIPLLFITGRRKQLKIWVRATNLSLRDLLNLLALNPIVQLILFTV